jgi:flagellar assembly protein FliH
MSDVLDTAFTPLVVQRVGEVPLDRSGEVERARTRAHADGYAAGRRLASEQAGAERMLQQEQMRQHEEEFALQRTAALHALDAAQARLDALTSQLSATTIDRIEALATELAAAIIGAELSDPARSAAHALRRAVDEMPVTRWTKVTFSSEDQRMLLADEQAHDLLRDVEVAYAADVGSGGAIVEIEHGAVDTRIHEALARARASLTGQEDAVDGLT